LDPGILFDAFYVFYTNGQSILSGSCYFQVTNGNFSRCYPLSGFRVGPAAATRTYTDGTIAAEEESMRTAEEQYVGSDAAAVPPEVAEKYWMLKALLP
jgi:hypothetical protein